MVLSESNGRVQLPAKAQTRPVVDDGKDAESLKVAEDQNGHPSMGVEVRRNYMGDYLDVPFRPYLMKILQKQVYDFPCDSHWDVVVRILRYIKSSPGKGLLFEDRSHEHIIGYTDADWAGSPSDRCSTSGYCVLVGATCELVWIKQLLRELKFGETGNMELVCDNQAALHIASNLVFHERTKHIEIDCHFVREKILSGDVVTKFVKSSDLLADIFTKSLTSPRINYICDKLGTYDLNAPA
ncbi:hypothetical protein FXO37_10260 [Capsicum annuum]|nr:hypothetical protein FXO37_10260 [Capsicum annuum]